jgi:hypothetical protein
MGVGVMKDKELNLEDVKAPHTPFFSNAISIHRFLKFIMNR